MAGDVLTGLVTSYWHRAQGGEPVTFVSRDIWVAWFCILVALIMAYLTNPSDAAFRSFLTDLSFHSHLQRLRTAAAQTTSPVSDAHVLNFSNRIAISLRTPPYRLRSFGFFSTVTVAPHPAEKRRSNDQGEGKGRDRRLGHRAGYFVGAFGRWWAVDDGSSEDGRVEKDRLASSVMAMEVVDSKGGAPNQATKEPKSKVAASTKAAPSQRQPVQIHSERTRENDHHALSDKASDIEAPLPTSAVLELQQQLVDLQTSSAEVESRLQDELDTLKARKRDEDAARAELKSKGRAAEETKRSADHEHIEATKKLTSARTSRQSAMDRLHSAEIELARLDRKHADLGSRSEKSTKHRTKLEPGLRKEVARRQQDLAAAESKAGQLARKVEELEGGIEHRKATIYARLVQSAVGRPSAPPYAMMPAAIVPWTVAPSEPLASTLAPHQATYPGPEPVGTAQPPTSSFLEHRLQHLSDHRTPSSAFAHFNTANALSVAPPPPSRGVPLPFFSPPLDEIDPLLAKGEPEDPTKHTDAAPLSPMTPNHRGLIPSTLFDMLEADGDVPEPPSGAAAGAAFRPQTQPLMQAQYNFGSRHPLSLNPDAKAFNLNRQATQGRSDPLSRATSQDWAHFSPFD